jgi:hypothetical protein
VKVRFVAGALLSIALLLLMPLSIPLPAGPGITFAYAADAIKPGRWEFTSQMQTPAMPATPQLPPGVTLPLGVTMPPAGGGMNVTHTSCIETDKAVPTDPRPECKIDRMQRDGGTVSWATTCTTGQGTIRSQGVARYSGDTMNSTLITQVPQAGGNTMETTQRITGRYLGPCAR